MTLLIAWLIIGGLHMPHGLYFISFVVWICHLTMINSTSSEIKAMRIQVVVIYQLAKHAAEQRGIKL